MGRNRLRQALFTLRHLLEPPSPVPAPVLVADRLGVRVVLGAFDCDALQFERCVQQGRHAEARALYTGELLSGFYDDWIDDERLRLAALYERAQALIPAGDGALGRAVPDAVTARSDRLPLAAPVDVGSRTMPVYLTRFFGRDAEGARLRALMRSHRLVTLLGPGGCGKTRLAVELAQALRESGAQGVEIGEARGAPEPGFDFVAFVSLVNCASRAQVLDVLLSSLHLRQQDDDAFEPLVAALTGRRALLVLDNFEQLSGLAEDVVARLVSQIPGLHLLVTSRRVLGLDGEREFAIEPLLLPRLDLPLAEAAINPAVALFVDRARAVRAKFHLGPSNLAAVLEMVHLLEGMPLAIELAAARVRSIPAAAMADLLRAARNKVGGHGLDLLTRSGPRSGSDLRHASMLRVIEWSWRLLDPAQARLLAALTVFHRGFTAAAALAVCGDLAQAHASVRLDDLVAHSLLRVAEAAGGATRCSTFEPVREYAALQLAAGDVPALRARHRGWLGDWARSLPLTPSLAEVRAEQPNLLAALANAAQGDPTGAAAADCIRMMLPLRRVLEDVELPADGLVSLAQAVASCADPALRSQGQTFLCPLLYIAGCSAEALHAAELGLAGAPPGSAWRGRALHAYAWVRWRATRLAEGVIALLDEAETLARTAVNIELLASIHALRGFVAFSGQQPAEGEALHEQALALWQQLGNQHAVNSGRYNLAVCAQNAGRHAQRLDRLDLVEANARALQDWRRLSQILNVRGNALCGLRRWSQAVECFREGARLGWNCLALHELAYLLWNLPRALAHVRDPKRALLLAAFAEAFWQARFGRLSPADLRDMRRVRRLAARQLDAHRIEALRLQGAQLSLTEAVALALR